MIYAPSQLYEEEGNSCDGVNVKARVLNDRAHAVSNTEDSANMRGFLEETRVFSSIKSAMNPVKMRVIMRCHLNRELKRFHY